MIPASDGSLSIRLLPSVLSVIAGSVDVITFVGLGGLFAAHITGNLAVVAALVVTGRAASLASILAVPVFIAVLALSRLAAAYWEESCHGSLRPLLTLQLALIASCLMVWVSAGSSLNPATPIAIMVGMLGVAAMAVQNALVKISLVDAPATAVMTTDITIFVMDVVAMLFLRDSNKVAHARSRARRTWPAIAGFTIGCGLGAILEAAIGPWSLALPTGSALLALALGISAERRAQAH